MVVVVAGVGVALLVLTVGSTSTPPLVLGGGVLALPVPMAVGLMREMVTLVSESGLTYEQDAVVVSSLGGGTRCFLKSPERHMSVA